MEVKIYTKSDCSFCVKAKEYLKNNGIIYTDINLNNQEDRFNFYKTNNVNSLPQIFINGKNIGGYTQLIDSELFNGDTLTKFNKTYKPFLHQWAVDITIRHEKTHWVEDEVELVEDVNQWKGGKMSPIKKEFITNILRLFTQLDVSVGQNYCDQFIPKFKNNEVRNMLVSFACREGTHQRAYALLNETLGLPDEEYHAFLNYKEMSDKIDCMMDSDVSTKPGLALALVKSVFNEGVSLFASFLMLLHFQRFGEMKGMGKVVEWSVRDETIHVEGISKLLNQFLVENPQLCTTEFLNKVISIAHHIVELEINFIELAYKLGPIDGLEKEDVINFIKYIADRRLLQIRFDPIFGVTKNPVDWMDWILNGVDHTNFFENRVTEYEIAGITGTWEGVYDSE